MRVKITPLEFPKSEHTVENDEDALYNETAKGIFAIADGVSATLFSDIWSDLVVKYAVQNPLFSDDPFEVQWWLEGIQPRYEEATPKPEELPHHAQDKARSGSLCTLAVLRVTDVTSDSAQAALVAFGDSVIMLQRLNGEIESFPIKSCEELGLAPICVPAKMVSFDRSFNRCETLNISFQVGETILLATDAVAGWILCAPERGQTIAEAFRVITTQTQDTWGAFVESRRPSREITDDDSTALILTFDTDARQGEGWQDLGKTAQPDPGIIKERRKELERELTAKNWERVAVLWGDGKQIQRVSGANPTPEQIKKAHRLADALADVRVAIRRGNKQNTESERNKIIGDAWDAHRTLLDHEDSVKALRDNLLRGGMITAPPRQEISPLPQKKIEPELATLTSQQEKSAEEDDPRRQIQKRASAELATAVDSDNDSQILEVKKKYEGPIIDSVLRAEPQLRERVELAETRIKVRAAIESDEELKIETAFLNSGLSADKFPPDIKTRIETAVALAPDVRAIKEALRAGDDEKIAALYSGGRLNDVRDLNNNERKQIREAIEIENWLKQLRAAMSGGDEQEIFRISQQTLQRQNKLDKLDTAERERVALAERCVKMPELVAKAIGNDDDREILTYYVKELERPFTKFAEIERDRIRLAIARKGLADGIVLALEDPDDTLRETRIIPLKSSFESLRNSNLLTVEQREAAQFIFVRDERIKALIQAIASKDEMRIAEKFEPLKADDRLDKTLRRAGERAEAQIRAADTFRRTVKGVSSMSLSQAQEIAQSYDASLLEGSLLLTEDERAQLEHARYLLQVEQLRQDEWESVRLVKEGKLKWDQLDPQQREQIQDTLHRFIAELQVQRAVLENNPKLLIPSYDSIMEEIAKTDQEKAIVKQAITARKSPLIRMAIRILG